MRNHEKPLDLGVLYVQKNPCGKRWKNYGWRRGFAGDPWAAYFCDISKFYQMNSNHGFASALVEPESLKGMNSVPFGLLDPFFRPGQTCMNREGGRSWICWKHIWDQDPRGYKHRSNGPGFRRLEPKGCHKKPWEMIGLKSATFGGLIVLDRRKECDCLKRYMLGMEPLSPPATTRGPTKNKSTMWTTKSYYIPFLWWCQMPYAPVHELALYIHDPIGAFSPMEEKKANDESWLGLSSQAA